MNYKQIVFFLFLNFLLFGCASTEKENKPLYPVLKDTLVHKAEYAETKVTRRTNYKAISLGKLGDTVVVDYYTGNFSRKMSESGYKNHMRYHRINIIAEGVFNPTADNIKVIVDTTQLIGKVEYHKSRKNHIYKAYPTYIINTSLRDTIAIGIDNNINATLEAKNKKNKWIRIERIPFLVCGTGHQLFVIPNKDTIITSTPIFKGNFKTKLRLKLGDAVSNEFEGHIYEEQLKMSDLDFF